MRKHGIEIRQHDLVLEALGQIPDDDVIGFRHSQDLSSLW